MRPQPQPVTCGTSIIYEVYGGLQEDEENMFKNVGSLSANSHYLLHSMPFL